jgi:methylglutaconyl-CoA hydratase
MMEIRLERLGGEDAGIVLLGLDRPAAKNALGHQLLSEFREALSILGSDAGVRVVVVHSLVPGIFCAGADLKERAAMSPSEAATFVQSIRTAFSELQDLPMPTIAAIEGGAFGGGLELALAADLRVAGSEAMMGLVETALAIIPGAGGTQRLPRLIGISRAKELIFTARRIGAEEAGRLGLVDRLAAPGEALPQALMLAREILPNGPAALRLAKQAVNRGSDLGLTSGLAFEQVCYAQVLSTQDRLEGLAAFREKRNPRFRGE